MEEKRAIECPSCKATLVGDIEFCPFCNTNFIKNKNTTKASKLKTNIYDNVDEIKIKFDKYSLPSLKEIKDKTFNFLKVALYTTKTFFKKLPNNLKTKPPYLLFFSLISFLFLIIVIWFGNILFNNISHQHIRSQLLSKDVETVEIEQPDETLITNMLPVDNKQSIYTNNDCSMLQYKIANKQDINEKCIVSVYVQPLTNLLDRRVYNNFGSVTTDTMTITMSIENDSKCKEPIDLLFSDNKKIRKVKRLNDFIINGITFQSYQLDEEFYLVAHLQDDYFFTYQATIKKSEAYDNFNQIFYITFVIDKKAEKR